MPPVSSPVPDFTTVLGQILQFLGVNGYFVALVLAVFAIQSWVSGGKQVVRGAAVVGEAVTRGGSWLVRQRPARIALALTTTVAVLVLQVFMVRLSYVGGSIIATPFDPVRRAALDAAYGSSPLLFTDAGFLSRFLAMDWISATYVLLSVLILVLAYRAGSSTIPTWLCLAAPYWLFLFGGFSVAAITLTINLLLAFANILAGMPIDWSLTQEYVLGAPYLTIDLVAGIYCVVAMAAVLGARAVRRLWTVEERQLGGTA
ncbi:hypothetical protein [Actinophytocola sp.]|uniref:hypothetical protein n=1 Tax=Actinophytocola sp. TaxID=1872138 RepID=UPI002EDB9800